MRFQMVDLSNYTRSAIILATQTSFYGFYLFLNFGHEEKLGQSALSLHDQVNIDKEYDDETHNRHEVFRVPASIKIREKCSELEIQKNSPRRLLFTLVAHFALSLAPPF